MKQLALISLLVFFAGCKKDPTPIIDSPYGAAKVMSVNAGQDFEIELPLSSPVRLNSSQSANYVTRQWRKISGPACLPADSIFYEDPELLLWEPGNYRFELTVLNRSRFLSDTINIAAKQSTGCSVTPDIEIMGKPTFTELNIVGQASIFLTAGEKVAGNNYFSVPPDAPYKIAIYDIPSEKLTTVTLDADAYQMSVANTNEAFYVAGGSIMDINSYTLKSNKVYIYDKKGELWSNGILSEARSNATGISTGDLVFFAGGISANGPSATVDIYNQLTKKWSTGLLSEARTDILAITDGRKVYFSGGTRNGVQSNKLDIYDIATDQWAVEQFTERYQDLKAFFAADKIYFAGNVSDSTKTRSVLEMKDLNGHHLGLSCLPAGISSTSQQSSLSTNQYGLITGMVLSPYSSILNLYEKQTGKWKLLIPDKTQPSALPGSAPFISYNNKLYGLVTNDFWDYYEPSLVSIDLK